ncbi:Uncharacterised protein [Streptococcus criceti]|uniref:Uncharacterized protein n=1 Tax=Streptococcus criceti HS-6 TaxID=873449 RepID=G5JP87_STRCG|nr:hypothetical protein [Streptococcus criceti]EHI73568.1 hypothetical protein STRCR_0321 [Streptococcus criceti HS-6]SUN41811.1 Uncharacterised protein [Streptococcus criceti]
MESIVFDKFESVQVNDLSEQIGGTINVGYYWGFRLGNLFNGGFSGGITGIVNGQGDGGFW